MRHVETTLARSMFNCDETAAYAAASLAFRDRLILEWNRTQQRQTYADAKRVYYLSLEFLMGRALDNAMLNIGQKDIAAGELKPKHEPLFAAFLTVAQQLVFQTSAFASRMSFHRSTMLRLATVASVALRPASSTVLRV